MSTQPSTRRTFIKQMGAISAAMTLPGCSMLKPASRPNIIWLSCEDISPALGCYGDAYADTPNIDALAGDGVVYDHAFATAPICAPARSCLITGLYATALGTQHLRSEIPRPEFIKPLPQLLRQGGYFCSNNSKTDYNFSADGLWDELSNQAHWRNRPADTPFFSVFNDGITHEGSANAMRPGDVQSLQKRHNPAKATLPPYYPDTPFLRQLWAHQYDLISVWDQRVGKFIDQLKQDGLYEDTIIFVFSDHGFGLPRYKRWMYNTGIQVPLVVRVPEKYKHLIKSKPGTHCKDLVSFVDFAPSVLRLAGLPVERHMQGVPFLGTRKPVQREYIHGARSRADDAYDISRAVRDQRYIYIRNFMPHLPYIQDAIIFGEEKGGFAELKRVRAEGGLPPAGEAMFTPKPAEELFDLLKDPHELNNLAHSGAHREVKSRMAAALDEWILDHRDTGFLIEAEMMMRAKGSTPYEMAQDPSYNLPKILETAKMVGKGVPLQILEQRLQDEDSGVRFWAAIALQAMGPKAEPSVVALQERLTDNSPAVQILCAEILCNLNVTDDALPVLKTWLQDEREWLVLWAAINTRQIGDKAMPILPTIKTVAAKFSGNVWNRYKSWSYPMFIGMALDKAMMHCGLQLDLSR